MKIVDCKAIREEILAEVKAQVEQLDYTPSLAIVKCNDDHASEVYVNNKIKTCESVGIRAKLYNLSPEETSYSTLHNAIIEAVNENDSVIIQFPLCDKFKSYEKELLKIVPYYKDCDGIVDGNILRMFDNDDESIIPCTVNGIYKFLKLNNIDIEGKNVVVVGRSKIVGKPMAQLMINNDATVTLCHSKTKNLAEHTVNADILIVAVGRPNFITANMVKDGAVVIDVGINRLETGKLVGDVAFDEVEPKVSYITPVPGGVGVLTTACVADNVLKCIRLNEKRFDNEEWKDIYYIDENDKIVDYRGRYQVSNLGRVKSLVDNLGRNYEKILKENYDDNHQYPYVNLYKNGKKSFKTIHKLVASMFLGNPKNLPIVNHKDENKFNNCVENLEWCTYKHNVVYGTARKRASDKMKGMPKTEEHKIKQSKIMKGRLNDDKNGAFKDYIVCTDKNGNFIGEYKGRTQAEQDIKERFSVELNKNSITRCCYFHEDKDKFIEKYGTKREQHKGFKFYYLKDYLLLNTDYRSKFSETHKLQRGEDYEG